MVEDRTKRKTVKIMLVFMFLSICFYASILFILFMSFRSSEESVIENCWEEEILYDGFQFIAKCLKCRYGFEEGGVGCSNSNAA